MTHEEITVSLKRLANNPTAGWVRVPGVGVVNLQSQSSRLLARRTDDQEWTDEAVRFWCACCWAGTKEWISDPRYLKVFEHLEKE